MRRVLERGVLWHPSGCSRSWRETVLAVSVASRYWRW